jgi:hypothetical protein
VELGGISVPSCLRRPEDRAVPRALLDPASAGEPLLLIEGMAPARKAGSWTLVIVVHYA